MSCTFMRACVVKFYSVVLNMLQILMQESEIMNCFVFVSSPWIPFWKWIWINRLEIQFIWRRSCVKPIFVLFCGRYTSLNILNSAQFCIKLVVLNSSAFLLEFDVTHECRVWFRWGDISPYLWLVLSGCMIITLVLNRYYIKHEIHTFHQYLNDFNTLKHWISLLLVAEDNHFQLVPSHDLDYFCGLQSTDSRGGKQMHIEYESRSKQKREESWVHTSWHGTRERSVWFLSEPGF